VAVKAVPPSLLSQKKFLCPNYSQTRTPFAVFSSICSGGNLDGHHDGRIELAWTDVRDGKLRHARLFGTEQIDEIADHAVETNSVGGQNVYIGAALRSSNTAPFGRCKDEDFLAATALWADLDDAEAVRQCLTKRPQHKIPDTPARTRGHECAANAAQYIRRM